MEVTMMADSCVCQALIANTVESGADFRFPLDQVTCIFMDGLRKAAQAVAERVNGATRVAEHSVVEAVTIEIGERFGREIGYIAATRQNLVHFGGSSSELPNEFSVSAKQFVHYCWHRLLRQCEWIS